MPCARPSTWNVSKMHIYDYPPKQLCGLWPFPGSHGTEGALEGHSSLTQGESGPDCPLRGGLPHWPAAWCPRLLSPPGASVRTRGWAVPHGHPILASEMPARGPPVAKGRRSRPRGARLWNREWRAPRARRGHVPPAPPQPVMDPCDSTVSGPRWAAGPYSLYPKDPAPGTHPGRL